MMKKIIPYIFITLILANIFAPFALEISSSKAIRIHNSIAEADAIVLKPTISANDSTIFVNIEVTWTDSTKYPASKRGVIMALKDDSGKVIQYAQLTKYSGDSLTQTGKFVSTGLKSYTPYTVSVRAFETSKEWSTIYSDSNFNGNMYFTSDFDYATDVITNSVRTLTAGETAPKEESIKTVTPDGMPGCTFNPLSSNPDKSFVGCIAIGIYYLFFKTTSFIFALTGKFFDFTFYYSVSDSSYRSPFVVEGWGLVRDFCNLFFIFVLLYIAFATILSLHGFKTKEMIMNVVIIGLLINFSLFAAQLVVDTSNILARVFYNPQVLVIGQNENDHVTSQFGANGELKLSEALVNKIDPQKLILSSAEVKTVKTKGDIIQDADNTNIDAGTFILVTLLATIVNVVGMIVFLSVGLIFIARVIGIWIYIIFAPLAFFSYTVPKMQGIDMIGWKKWWPELISMSFLAPIFIFFLYLIIKFLNTGLSLINAKGQHGINFVVAIIVPFAFIMILLMRAKSIAKDMSGKLGQSITGGIAAAGSAVLGGAALGTAFLGRQTIGAFMKGASTGDSTNQRFANGTSRGGWDRFKGAIAHYGTGTLLTRAQQSVGTRLNADQTRVEGYAHARQELDKAAGERFHGKKFNELTQTERNTIRQRVSRDHEGQQQFGKTYNQLTQAQKTTVDTTVNPQLAARTSHADHLVTEGRGKQGLISKITQSSRNGSFDVRNLSQVVANEYDRGFSKLMTGITANLAKGMRGGLKQSGLNYGTGQKDFLKDLGHTITEALKSTKVKVDLSHVGEEKKEDGGGHH